MRKKDTILKNNLQAFLQHKQKKLVLGILASFKDYTAGYNIYKKWL